MENPATSRGNVALKAATVVAVDTAAVDLEVAAMAAVVVVASVGAEVEVPAITAASPDTS